MSKDTKAVIIVATKKVMWADGINKVTVEKICSVSNVSRMTFYRYFEDKYDVIRDIIEEVYNDVAIHYEIIYNKNIPFKEKVMEVIKYHQDATKGISADMMRDIYIHDNKALREFIMEKRDFYKNITLKYILIEQKKGNFRANLTEEFITFQLNYISELIMDPRLKNMFESTDILINQIYKMLYFGIVKR